ncbi:dimethylsulfonioproprionate lyase DddP [Jannaschia seohaensis]|uniref:Xaa-Pro aminopeptidase n=1 Tax=Jannaschia seohaensis TaxID=475081 RepID=A0A2Y9A223_9RHOB|nr:dimethylsulfonioproprionate lyase DddP [Jannaschia seohaensis]PWJ22222.1 Xaa-Pro aminopeptidase [Jannaschia seohaensis]SSA38500.1 Xaa-Pro aminopeptidase [Jannaschia seohaensis]
MKDHAPFPRKIDPSRGTHLGDGTPNDADRVEIGPTPLAFAEWEARGLALPDLAAMRRYRLDRLRDQVVARGLGGLLVFDPLNIRYATDTTNMQLWNAHNPFRAALVCADGYMVLWDYRIATFLSEYNPLVAERRAGADLFYFTRGEGIDRGARIFAGEVRDLLREHGGGLLRLACDKPTIHGLRALEASGIAVLPGEALTERARSVKSPDEIAAMRCAIHTCEVAMQEMETFARTEIPRGGVTENDVWAELHASNIRRGGEWIETRLLASGPRTNPWFQECGPREISENEILAFDTDLVGPYGFCCDMSRTWWIGDGPARPDIVDAMRHSLDHIRYNETLLIAGTPLDDLPRMLHTLRPEFQALKYGCAFHGVGLCDEWPMIAYPDQADPGYAGGAVLEPGMVLCVEVLTAEDGGDFSIKLEDQVLVTETGPENLSRYPFDPRLL